MLKENMLHLIVARYNAQASETLYICIYRYTSIREQREKRAQQIKSFLQLNCI